MLYSLLISLPMMMCLFWTIFFLIRSIWGSDEPRIKWTILLFYIASTILYTNHWLFFSNAETPLGTYTYFIANLSVYPIYYLYLRALTRTRFTRDNCFSFIPAVLVALFFPLNLHFGWISGDTLFLFVRICFAIQVIGVWISCFRLLRATRQRLDNTYADNRSYVLQPTLSLLILTGVTACASILQDLLGREMFDGSLLVYIPAVLMSALLYGLGYVAAHTTLPKETVAQEEEQEQTRIATTAESDELMYKISTIMREKQLFTNPHLTIQDLAAAVGSNRTYVSNCINRCTGYSFSQYVARYRVEHAQQVLLNPKYNSDHDAIADAAALSGFSSDQTFYRVFKDITGLTPLLYRQQNRQK